MKMIKALMVVVLAVSALGLGACAQQRKSETMSTTSSGSTYSK
ncbi:hypothetical protein BH20VER1_BH20VER1_31100 [soil metagenome]|jgi:uncharacterized lipoprotein YehR (DUF1307 family)